MGCSLRRSGTLRRAVQSRRGRGVRRWRAGRGTLARGAGDLALPCAALLKGCQLPGRICAALHLCGERAGRAVGGARQHGDAGCGRGAQSCSGAARAPASGNESAAERRRGARLAGGHRRGGGGGSGGAVAAATVPARLALQLAGRGHHGGVLPRIHFLPVHPHPLHPGPGRLRLVRPPKECLRICSC